MIYPDWKILLAEKHLRERTSPEIEEVRNLLSVFNGTCEIPHAIALIKECHTIYKEGLLSKEVLEGCFLCQDSTVHDIQDVTGMPLDMIEVYHQFFFDTKVFKYRLQKYDYVRTYENKTFPEGPLYKRWALSVGIQFFRWHLGVSGDLIPKKVLMDLIGDTFIRSKEHLNEPITSETARQSLKWIKQASDSIGVFSRIEEDNSSDMQNQVRIALEYHDTTKRADEISDAEILS